MKFPRWTNLLFVAAAAWMLGGCGSDDEDNGSNGGTCDGVTCGDHGTCNPDTGSCECETGYSGSDCSECAGGYVSEGGVCVAADCTTNAECNDGIACNGEETCDGGKCESGGAVSCGDHASCQEPGGTCVCDDGYHQGNGGQCLPDECTGDTECDDGLVCNGEETCTQGTCQAGTPVTCGTNASCQEPEGDCVCDDGYESDGGVCVAVLEVLGPWYDEYGSYHRITRNIWHTGDWVFHISQFDNDEGFLVAQNGAANPYNPDLWSRFDWTWQGADLYYCQIAYDAADEATAAADTSADRADLAEGCAGNPWTKMGEGLEIVGRYLDDWGYTHDVMQTTWVMGDSVFHVSQFDNGEGFLVAQNDETNLYNPDLWSRFDWTWDGADLYYCQIAYDAADEATAAAEASADPADLAEGCAGNPWSKLDARVEPYGAWIDDWDGTHDVTETTWAMGESVFHISQVNNQDNFLVAQNDAANAYNPGLWSRFDWTFDYTGDLFYCQIAYDAADESTAAADTSADRTDLAAGCAGNPWSKLNERVDVFGSWEDSFGSLHDVTQTTWDTEGLLFHISQFDNQANFLVAQNDAANAYNPDLWSRFDWTYDFNGDLYYCQIAYDAADESTAAADTSADRTDLAAGCAGFAWSLMTAN